MVLDMPLMCWEYSDTTGIIKVQSSHIPISSWVYYLIESNDALYIHMRELELSLKAGITRSASFCDKFSV